MVLFLIVPPLLLRSLVIIGFLSSKSRGSIFQLLDLPSSSIFRFLMTANLILFPLMLFVSVSLVLETLELGVTLSSIAAGFFAMMRLVLLYISFTCIFKSSNSMMLRTPFLIQGLCLSRKVVLMLISLGIVGGIPVKQDLSILPILTAKSYPVWSLSFSPLYAPSASPPSKLVV